MKEYHKIDGLYLRDEVTKRLIPGVYRNPLVSFLANNQWIFTEKVDGMNIRVVWDGHEVSFYGRTDKAIIPPKLQARLEELFSGEINEQIFEQNFGDKTVVLYGEGYGAGIQTGGSYRSDNDFILFDVEINNIMLQREDAEEIAKIFGFDTVPIVLRGTIAEAEQYVKSRPTSKIGTCIMEGVVGRPAMEIRDRVGKRAIVKIKVRDYNEIDSY